VLLNTKSEWVGSFVSNEDKGYNWFDAKAEWKGYLIHNGQKGYNLFNIEGDWAGFLALKLLASKQ